MQIFLCVQCISGRALSKTSFYRLSHDKLGKSYFGTWTNVWNPWNFAILWDSPYYTHKLWSWEHYGNIQAMLDPNILAFYGSASTSESDSRLAPQDSDPKRGSKKDQCPLWSAFDPNERVCSKMNRRFRKLICKYLFAKYVFEVTVRKKLVSPKMTHHSVLYTAFTRIINTFIPYV